MAEVREEWWIPQLRSKVKKIVNSCYLCKVLKHSTIWANRNSCTIAIPHRMGTTF